MNNFINNLNNDVKWLKLNWENRFGMWEIHIVNGIRYKNRETLTCMKQV